MMYVLHQIKLGGWCVINFDVFFVIVVILSGIVIFYDAAQFIAANKKVLQLTWTNFGELKFTFIHTKWH